MAAAQVALRRVMMQQVAERRKVLSVLDEMYENFYGEGYAMELLMFKQRAFDNGWGITNIASFSRSQWCGLEVPVQLADTILSALSAKRIRADLLPAESPRAPPPEGTTPTVGANPNGPLARGSQSSSSRASGLGAAGGSGDPAASGSGGSAANAPGSAGAATWLGKAPPGKAPPVHLRPATTTTLAVAATGPPGLPAGTPQGSAANRHQSPGQVPRPTGTVKCRHLFPRLPDECWFLEPLRMHELESLLGGEEVKSITNSIGSHVNPGEPMWDLTTFAYQLADRSVFFTEPMLKMPVRPEPTYWFTAYWGGKKSTSEYRWIEMGCRVCGYRTNRIHLYAPSIGEGQSNMDILTEAFRAFFHVR
jgi:hypothetical protein